MSEGQEAERSNKKGSQKLGVSGIYNREQGKFTRCVLQETEEAEGLADVEETKEAKGLVDTKGAVESESLVEVERQKQAVGPVGQKEAEGPAEDEVDNTNIEVFVSFFLGSKKLRQSLL